MTSSFNKMLTQSGYTKTKCGNICRKTKMKNSLEFKTVSISNSGDYYQIIFDDGLDSEVEPYFLIQGESGFEDEGFRYFESHIESLIGHYIPKSASLSTSPHFSPGGGMVVLGSCLHRIRASMHIIAQGFGFTRDFTLKGTEV